MEIILQGLEHVAAIQDDILNTGKDDEQHIQISEHCSQSPRQLRLAAPAQEVQVHAAVST